MLTKSSVTNISSNIYSFLRMNYKRKKQKLYMETLPFAQNNFPHTTFVLSDKTLNLEILSG